MTHRNQGKKGYIMEKKLIIHLLTTTLCLRDCKHCCNKQYDLNEVPYVTEDELNNCETILLTGGEPALFSNIYNISYELRKKYPNIKNIYLYANALEFSWAYYDCINGIDGVNISVKTPMDRNAFLSIQNSPMLTSKKSNRVYVFDDLIKEEEVNEHFKFVKREWQENFVPASDSIFRKR